MVAANILNKQSRQPTRGGTLTRGLGEVLTTAHRKKTGFAMKYMHLPRAWTDLSVRPKQLKTDLSGSGTGEGGGGYTHTLRS